SLLLQTRTEVKAPTEQLSDLFIILLDDLGNFRAIPEFMMTLKQTLELGSIKKTGILVGIASTPANWLELTSMEQHHPLSRYFLSKVRLSSLTAAEVEETVLKTLSRTGVIFTDEIISRVYEYTEGHPFEMQVLCYHLFRNQLARRVDVDVWEKALQSAL